ncbi:MAG: MerR family transcriptional regulator [Bacillota bacterium]
MLMSDVCRETGLTRKAIEYYIEQGLLSPGMRENGYRVFDMADAERLRKIAALRALNVGIAHIREILSGSADALRRAAHEAALMAEDADKKHALLERLANGASYMEVAGDIAALENKRTILQKLLGAFPGYYGQAFSLHFAAFLNEPITTQEQKQAYDTIVEYLDRAESFILPEDLREYLGEATRGMAAAQMSEASAQLREAVEDVDAYIAKNREELEQYIAFKQSAEYKNSPACRLQNILRQFQKTGGYNDIFLPAMERLSEGYRRYRAALKEANDALLARYPQIREWYPE